ncbi:MAG: peptide deformylase, partial [Sinomicrobium sp.]|nr:peptide deformylase [Sinomicrobium sp.]
CAPVQPDEVADLQPAIDTMAACILAFREKYGAGRAIAAPQIGLMKRMVVMNIDEPIPFFNPELFDQSDEMMELWDDCMSFPDLLVKLKRHQSCKMRFRDNHWQEQVWELEGDLSELLQHEVDHLDGILATMRAEGERALQWRSAGIALSK